MKGKDNTKTQMIFHSLALQLRDAGFPQQYQGGAYECSHGFGAQQPSIIHNMECKTWAYHPTLEELIMECGKRVVLRESGNLTTKEWTAELDTIVCKASSPLEAVAKLFIALHTHAS